jgi:hypothetical protein
MEVYRNYPVSRCRDRNRKDVVLRGRLRLMYRVARMARYGLQLQEMSNNHTLVCTVMNQPHARRTEPNEITNHSRDRRRPVGESTVGSY